MSYDGAPPDTTESEYTPSTYQYTPLPDTSPPDTSPAPSLPLPPESTAPPPRVVPSPGPGGPTVRPSPRYLPLVPGTDYNNQNVADQQRYEQWLEDNVYTNGWVVDMVRGVIFDPQTRTVVGPVPPPEQILGR